MKHSIPKHRNNGMTRREVTRKLGLAVGIGLVGVPYARAAAQVAAEAAAQTPPQVEGPFHPIHKQADTDLDLVMIKGHQKSATGEVIGVQGRVVDTNGRPLAGVEVDVWQANHHGRYSHTGDPNPAPLDPDFQGQGIVTSDSNGRYAIRTIKPGAYPLIFLGEDGWRCRHIHFKLSGTGVNSLTTQMYFEGDPLIAQDMEIAKAPRELRSLLIASASPDPTSGVPIYTFDIVLQQA
ncbi:MAG: protocatechuate 3,4-dioxygenase [Proteobacteria bacterium]|nr:protocatechuate 3,4-dioxygenase [Pseudomonadota bacterium]